MGPWPLGYSATRSKNGGRGMATATTMLRWMLRGSQRTCCSRGAWRRLTVIDGQGVDLVNPLYTSTHPLLFAHSPYERNKQSNRSRSTTCVRPYAQEECAWIMQRGTNTRSNDPLPSRELFELLLEKVGGCYNHAAPPHCFAHEASAHHCRRRLLREAAGYGVSRTAQSIRSVQ